MIQQKQGIIINFIIIIVINIAIILITIVVVTIIDIVTRLQTAPEGFYKGTIDCVKKTIQWEGFRGFYAGTIISISIIINVIMIIIF